MFFLAVESFDKLFCVYDYVVFELLDCFEFEMRSKSGAFDESYSVLVPIERFFSESAE